MPSDYAAALLALAQHEGLQAQLQEQDPSLLWRRAQMVAQLLPHPVDGQRALLSVTVRPLQAELFGLDAASLCQALRWLFQTEADLLAPQQWALGIDDEDQLVLGIDLSLTECTPQTLLPRVAQGFDLGQTLSELWDALAVAQERS
ncbi:MAG: hypothetical protein WCK08_21065 [Betaproteobacteria bacterium]